MFDLVMFFLEFDNPKWFLSTMICLVLVILYFYLFPILNIKIWVEYRKIKLMRLPKVFIGLCHCCQKP